MKFLLFLIINILVSINSALAYSALTELLILNLLQNHGCEQYEEVEEIPNSRIIETRNGRHAISNITMDKAISLFNEISANEEIPFDFTEDGCFQRAHMMSFILDQQGINTVKIFTIGNLRVDSPHNQEGYVEWGFHVAPAICVRENGMNKLTILDPSIFDRPVTLREWVEKQTSHAEGGITELHITTRFSFFPGDIHMSSKTSFTQSDMNSTREVLRNYLEIQMLRPSVTNSNQMEIKELLEN